MIKDAIKQEHFLGELKLSYSSFSKPDVKITNSSESAAFFRSIWEEGTIELRENSMMFLLNTRNYVTGWKLLNTGTLTTTHMDQRAIFQTTLLANARFILLAHNHPSGIKTPSTEDKQITKDIQSAGKLFNITLIDHIILTVDDYYSFADEGQI